MKTFLRSSLLAGSLALAGSYALGMGYPQDLFAEQSEKVEASHRPRPRSKKVAVVPVKLTRTKPAAAGAAPGRPTLCCKKACGTARG